MPYLLLTELPKFDCLLEASKHHPDLDPSACEVFLQLLHTGDQVHRHESEYLKSHSIAQGRFGVLMLLGRQGKNCSGEQPPTTPAELADAAGVTRATMTGLIDTLERDQLVSRKTDPADRRTLRVSLTEKGEQLMERLLPGYFRHITAAMTNLSEEERRTLVQLLGKIQDAIPAPGQPLELTHL